jgi:type IV pilus biogenesis protein CpaD/CtpE
MTPSDSGRAAVVFSAYRTGETTSAAQEELVAGRISRAVE